MNENQSSRLEKKLNTTAMNSRMDAEKKIADQTTDQEAQALRAEIDRQANEELKSRIESDLILSPSNSIQELKELAAILQNPEKKAELAALGIDASQQLARVYGLRFQYINGEISSANTSQLAVIENRLNQEATEQPPKLNPDRYRLLQEKIQARREQIAQRAAELAPQQNENFQTLMQGIEQFQSMDDIELLNIVWGELNSKFLLEGELFLTQDQFEAVGKKIFTRQAEIINQEYTKTFQDIRKLEPIEALNRLNEIRAGLRWIRGMQANEVIRQIKIAEFSQQLDVEQAYIDNYTKTEAGIRDLANDKARLRQYRQTLTEAQRNQPFTTERLAQKLDEMIGEKLGEETQETKQQRARELAEEQRKKYDYYIEQIYQTATSSKAKLRQLRHIKNSLIMRNLTDTNPLENSKLRELLDRVDYETQQIKLLEDYRRKIQYAYRPEDFRRIREGLYDQQKAGGRQALKPSWVKHISEEINQRAAQILPIVAQRRHEQSQERAEFRQKKAKKKSNRKSILDRLLGRRRTPETPTS